MDVTLLQPGFLLVLLVAPLPWILTAPGRDRTHALLRSMLLALLALALARPIVVTERGPAHHLFVLDRTESAAEDERRAARAAVTTRLDAAPSSVRARLIELPPARDAREGAAATPGSRRGASPLGAALAEAGRAIPEGAAGAVVLVSDGLATDQGWSASLQALCERGIPVHTCPLAPRGDDVRPVALLVPEDVRVGQTARVVVAVEGGPATVDVRLLGPDGELARVRDLAVAGRTTAALEFEPGEPGFLPVTAEVLVTAGADAVPHDNRMERTIAVQEPLRVLYLGRRMTGGGARLAELVGDGFAIDAPAADMPIDPAGLRAYDLVVLDDRRAETVPGEAQTALADAIADAGLGLVVSGGREAFGPGGYHESALASILPVEFVKKEEKRDPSTTLVVIIDTSGSMGGNRVQLAKEVARLAIRRLLPHDKVGIVEFYGAKRWAAPIQPASNSIELERALNRLDAGGGTVILPAIEEAFYGLQNVQTRYKHVLVLTDGGVETGAFEPLLRRMAEKGINVSTVLIGPDAHSEFLVTLANWGKGRFYSVPNRFNLPEVLLKQPAGAALPAYREGEHRVAGRGGPGWWGAVSPASVPPLRGYVETKRRPGAEVLLESVRGRHPILATWRYGLGRVTTLATEPAGAGTETWRDWDGYGPFLARVMSRTASDGRRPFAFTLDRDGHELTLSAMRRSGRREQPEAAIVDDAGREHAALEFRRRSPDLFTAAFVHPPDEEVRIRAGAGTDLPVDRVRLVSAAHADEAEELQADPLRGLDLERVAAVTGGTTVDLADLSTAPLAIGAADAPLGVLPLWPACLVLALLAFLAELLYRRLPRSRQTGPPPRTAGEPT